MKKTENKKIYGLYVGSLVLLIVIALLLPQFFFYIQDRYWMARTAVDVRSSVDLSQLNSFYEEKMYDRMSNFAAMNRDSLTVTAIEHDIKEEAESEAILEQILYQDWSAIMLTTVFQDSFGQFWDSNSLEIQDCKKYIVYEEDFETGVALMMWYFDINVINTDKRIRLLADTETDSIYYMKITTNDTNQVVYYDGEKDNVMQATSSAMYEKESKLEQLFMWVEQFQYQWDFYASYYEGEQEDIREFLYDSPESKTDWENSGEMYGYVEVKDDQCMVEIPLIYENLGLDFLFEVLYRNDTEMTVSMGIPAIGELIPEMIQD